MHLRNVISCICFTLILGISNNYAKTIQWLDGNWTGMKYQTNMDQAWKMKLTCNSKKNIYTVEYPDLHCKGNLVVVKIMSKRVILTEKITSGTCLSDGYIIITFAGEGLVTFTCLRDNKTRLASYCTLQKS